MPDSAPQPSPLPTQGAYWGRLAPSPTGYLHIGHARTFAIAAQRASAADGRLLLRNDDLDVHRCRPEFVTAFVEDLNWLGLAWQPPIVSQSARIERYREVLEALHRDGLIFPCSRSRKDVLEAASAPHEGEDPNGQEEPLYPTAFRPAIGVTLPALEERIRENWRFRVPDGETLTFADENFGQQEAVSGQHFGDFLVWRKDGLPSYQLATVVDDLDFGIAEVVRGADLIRSTFRQLLLFRALHRPAPRFYHCALVTDEKGVRLAKRHDALSIRALRLEGKTASEVLAIAADFRGLRANRA